MLITPTAIDLTIAAIVFGLACIGTWIVAGVLTRRAVLDQPNHRSSHSVPIPRGGGIAIVGAVTAGWFLAVLLGADPGTVSPIPMLCVVGLAIVSFMDDVRSLPAAPRLLAQAIAVAFGLWAFGGHGAFAAFLPRAIDLALTALCWLWFINLVNFMDGIDGITGTETISVTAGLVVLASAGAASTMLFGPSLALGAAAAGFLVWNWHPARVFIGDVGSVPLGFALGLLLVAHASGDAGDGVALTQALILPLVYVVDASATLARRVARGEKPTEAHREHVYQRAVQAGLRPGAVCLRIAGANVILIALALFLAPWSLWLSLVAGLGVVGGLFLSLRPAPLPCRDPAS
ncbi:MAG: glycosyltransferase family 4 protein [Alphaproteobacteria bacterium]|nr:glycosyltransferase family 4 protein [Alphaproteobacteria bacterium]